MKILAIDPGFERVGIAVLEKQNDRESILFSSCFKTEKTIPFNERLLLIGEEVERIINKYKPSILSIETLLFNNNKKTAMMVAEARGVMIYEATRKKMKICEYTPLQIKIAVTGYGRADKNQVNVMTRQIVKIENSAKIDDEIDAIAIALTCSASYKAP